MKKLLLVIALVALVPNASFVSADPREAIRNPPTGLRGTWRCQQEDQAKLDKSFKSIQDSATKHLETLVDKKRQPARSF
jgi:hypothetical protein